MPADETVKPNKSTDEGKKQVAAIRQNDVAMSALTIALRGSLTI